MAPSFETAFRQTDGYHLSTPYGTLSILNEGRRIIFDLYSDVRESIHHKALFSYYQQLQYKGVTQINVDHIDLPGLDRTINLKRGNARLDLVYLHRGTVYEVELKTHREVGLDVTAIQLKELAKHCKHLIVVVPRRDVEDMNTILAMLKLEKAITVDSFEIYEKEGEHLET